MRVIHLTELQLQVLVTELARVAEGLSEDVTADLLVKQFNETVKRQLINVFYVGRLDGTTNEWQVICLDGVPRTFKNNIQARQFLDSLTENGFDTIGLIILDSLPVSFGRFIIRKK